MVNANFYIVHYYFIFQNIAQYFLFLPSENHLPPWADSRRRSWWQWSRLSHPGAHHLSVHVAAYWYKDNQWYNGQPTTDSISSTAAFSCMTLWFMNTALWTQSRGTYTRPESNPCRCMPNKNSRDSSERQKPCFNPTLMSPCTWLAKKVSGIDSEDMPVLS